jgi:opacity protein-like surface antigen
MHFSLIENPYKMRNRLFWIALLALFAGPVARGQGSFFGLSYNTAMPLGETQEFVDAYSWRGVSMEWRWFLQDRLSAGIFFGWNVFHQKVTGDFELENGALSGTQLRTINAFPILATGHYYFGNELEFRPYVGLGLGTYRTRQRSTMGIFQVETNQWQFGFAPSVGVTFPLGFDLMGNLEVRYNYAIQAGDALNHSYLGINLGLAWSSY